MIKGIFLREKPEIPDESLSQVLEKFDPLKEVENSCMSFEVKNDKTKSITRREFYEWEDPYHFITYSTSDLDTYNDLSDIFDILSTAVPNFVGFWQYGESTLLIAWPHSSKGDAIENMSRGRLFDELVRFTGWCINSTLGDYIDHIQKVESYYNYIVTIK